MKTAKELIIPFTWEERRVQLLDPSFLYIPGQISHKESREINFDSPNVQIEFCSGTGAWISTKAKENPSIFWIAVEKKFERAKKIWQKQQNEGLVNLMIVCAEAEEFIKFYIPKAEEVFVNFPDPWPKRRHEKHRLIRQPFLTDLVKIGVKRATCVTDDLPYANQMLKEFEMSKEWKLDFHIHHWPEYGSSYFESLWKSKGRTIHYLSFKRKPCS